MTPTNTRPPFPMRQVHLDFHTAPEIPDVGADWDADAFIETLQAARVNSITLFAVCHHGMAYYPTNVGTRHPSLKFDLLGEQIEACRRAGIRCPVYVTVAWNVDAARRHPEWLQVDIHGKQVGPGPLEPGWPWLCVGTEYAEELLAQTRELIDLYKPDGFFYDILMYHADGCVNPPALKSLRAHGLDPRNPLDRRRNNHIMARRFMERASGLVREHLPDAGLYYNSRWGLHFADEYQYYSQNEIESLPTGGWGYGFYPLWSRHARLFGLPMLGMTGRFHRTWADWGGLKHPDALRFECGGIVANGGAISIGDQLHPRGRLNTAVYDVIGEAFRDVEKVEEYCLDAKPVTEVGLLLLEPNADKANQTTGGIKTGTGENVEGAARMLLELHQQFDVITDRVPGDFSRYDLLVLPDHANASPETVTRLKAYVANGGKILVSHEALLEHGNFLLSDEIGADYVGPAEGVPDYFAVEDTRLHGPVTRPGFHYSLYEGPTCRVQPRAGTQILCGAYETYFNRTGDHFCSHGFTPPTAAASAYPAVTRNGGVIYVYGPIFTAYQKYGTLAYRGLVGGLLNLLLPEPLLITDAPAPAEVTLTEQPGRRIVHVVNYSAQRRATGHVEVLAEPVPLRNVTVSLRDGGNVTRAFLAASGQELPLSRESGRVLVVIPEIRAHEIVVFAENG